jgi:hypothetical protein
MQWMEEEPVRVMNRGRDGFSPKVLGRLKFIQHRSYHLNETLVTSFNNTILLKVIRSGELVLDPFILKELAHGAVLELETIAYPNFLDLHFLSGLGLLGKVNLSTYGFHPWT